MTATAAPAFAARDYVWAAALHGVPFRHRVAENYAKSPARRRPRSEPGHRRRHQAVLLGRAGDGFPTSPNARVR